MSTNAAFIECQTSRAELKEVKACHVKFMVEYMYDESYTYEKGHSGSSPHANATEDPESIEFTMALMILADRYNVAGLKTVAENRVLRQINASTRNAGKFATLVNKIYDNEDISDSVLQWAISAASENLESLYTDDPASLIETKPEFALEVLKTLVKERGEGVERNKKRRAEIDRRRAAGERVSEDGWYD